MFRIEPNLIKAIALVESNLKKGDAANLLI